MKLNMMVLMFVILASFCYAALTDNLIVYLEMGNNEDTSGENNDFQVYGTPAYWNNGSCHIGTTCAFFPNVAPTSDAFLYIADMYDNLSIKLNFSTTINLWWHSFDTNALRYIGNEGGGGGQTLFITAGNIKYYDGAASIDSGVPVYTGTWSMFTAVYNNATLNTSIYINGTYKNSNIAAKSGADAMFFGVGSDTEGTTLIGGDVGIYGMIDDFSFHSRALSAAEISDLWNSGAGTNLMADVTSPTITISSPDTSYNETYNTDVYINISTDETANCSVNLTDFSLYYSNITFFSYKETSLTTDFYSVRINCTDTSDNMQNDTVYFYKDVSSPYISNLTGINLTNISTHYQRENNDGFGFELDLNDDLDLFTFEFNLSYANGTTINNTKINLSVNVQTIYHANFSYNMLSYPNVTYRLDYRLCDSHTSKYMQPFKNIITDNGFLNFTDDEMYISLKTNYENSIFEVEKLDDRYIFSSTSRMDEKHIYTLTSNEPIYYIMNSKYKGHFVIGKYWIDFEPYDVIIYPVENYYRIEIKTDDIKAEFRSIGELNCISSNFTLQLTHTPATVVSYNASKLIGGTKWFNHEALDYTTVAGSIMFIFSFLIVIAVIGLGELTRIPIIQVFGGMLAFFYGFLLFSEISAIFGAMFIVLSVIYIIKGAFAAKY